MKKIKSSAKFSNCKEYRWNLTRYINNSKKELIFIGLNPSLADATKNDPTLKRLLGFAEQWGYGSLIVINLFGRVCSSPKLLALFKDPVGSKNDYELNKKIKYWSNNKSCDLWIGWGVNGKLMKRNEKILRKIKKSPKDPYVLGLTKEKHPLHPLYISKKQTLFQIQI